MELNTTTAKLLISFLILVVGYLVIRIGSSLILTLSKKREIISVKHIWYVKVFRYLVMILTILAALIYLRTDLIEKITNIGREFVSETYKNLLLNILIIILLIILAIIVV